MPTYKKPLDIASSAFIRGDNSQGLSPAEMQSLGDLLISRLGDEIIRMKSLADHISDMMDELEAQGFTEGDGENLQQYIRLFTPLHLSLRNLNRLERNRIKIRRMLDSDFPIRTAGSGGVASSHTSPHLSRASFRRASATSTTRVVEARLVSPMQPIRPKV